MAINIGNVPGSALGVEIDINPTPAILIAQFEKFGLDIRSFKEPLKRSVARVIAPSIGKNFELGGRPPWAPLSEFTIAQRATLGYGPTPILVRSGNLQRVAQQQNIWTISTDRAYIAGLPDKAWYGIVHQQGREVGGRGIGVGSLSSGRLRSADIGGGGTPARPFLEIQTEDVNGIQAVFEEWMAERMLAAGFGEG